MSDPPPRSPPTCARHSPSTSSGEHDVEKPGGLPVFSFRHRTVPLAASRQESVPCTPSVTTLPPATAGDERAPGKPLAGPPAGRVAYSSFQISLPVAASRQRITSLPLSYVNV